MACPVHLRLGAIDVQAHLVAESLAYFVGFRLYLWQRRRSGDYLGETTRWWIVVAGMLGAVAGSKLIYWLSDPWLTADRLLHLDLRYLLGGKSIAGALVGGLAAVEWVKRPLGISRSTGDLFAVPLTIGIAIGRIGCFLAGLDDHTYGLPTTLPWAVDFGDGVPRHPTQLYEALFLVLLALFLGRWCAALSSGRPASGRPAEGDLFKIFMVAYFGFRLSLEQIKPGVPLAGLVAIQWLSLAVLLYYAQLFVRQRLWPRLRPPKGKPLPAPARDHPYRRVSGVSGG
jgi:prolipoprotein diacylglyceryltransferase